MDENTIKFQKGLRVLKRQKGRFISEDERKLAAMRLEMYRAALASPDGRYCLNPEDQMDERTYMHADKVLDYLLRDLQNVVDHGTFHDAHIDVNGMAVRDRVGQLRAHDLSYEKAVAQAAAEFSTSERTIRRIVDGVTAKS